MKIKRMEFVLSQNKLKKKKKKSGAGRFFATFFVSLFALCSVGAVFYIVTAEQLDWHIVTDFLPHRKQSEPTGVSAASAYGLVQESEAVDNSYFDDAVFLGDSLTDGMRLVNYVNDSNIKAVVGISIERVLKEKAFELRSGNMGTAVRAVSERNPSKIYVMLGTNGIEYSSVDTLIEQYAQLIDKLKENNTGAILYIQSIPPSTSGYINSKERLSTKKIKQYNEALLKLAEEKECYFLDTYSLFVTESGYLPRALSSGDGLHLNVDAYHIMFDYIKKHTVR